MKKFYAIALAMVSFTVSASGADVRFTYNQDNLPVDYFGYGKLETFDIAVRLGSELAGSKVKEVEVTLPVSESQVADLKGWMSTELRLANRKNMADLAEYDATLSGTTLTAVFSDPVEVPADGAYVGYSFTITSLEGEGEGLNPSKPVVFVEGTNPDGLYMHASRSVVKWKSMVETVKGVSPMVVTLEGNYGADACAPVPDGKYYVAVGEPGRVSVPVVNHGSAEISTVDYSWTAVREGESFSGNGTYRFDVPVASAFGSIGTIVMELPAFDEVAAYEFTVTIDKVNGFANGEMQSSAKTVLSVAPFIPIGRPLVEEYTGLWCKWCPSGYVALEEGAEQYGDKFVAIAYHYDDPMSVTDAFPQAVSSFPNSAVNRGVLIDPNTLLANYEEVAQGDVPCNIDVEAAYESETNHNLIRVKSTVRFMDGMESANYRIGYVLVADNLHNDSWRQQNAFSGASGENYQGKWWDLFTQEGSSVRGLVFNFVAVNTEYCTGIEGSLPSSIEQGTPYENEVSFDVQVVRNMSGSTFINEDAAFRVIAFVINGIGGAVVNSNSSVKVDDPAGVGHLTPDALVQMIEYYDLQGRRVDANAKGLVIKVETLSDGSRRQVKTIR